MLKVVSVAWSETPGYDFSVDYVCREERRHMTAPHRWILCLLLVGVLLSCGGDGRSPGGGGTCLAITVTYNGSKSGPAYLRIVYSDGGHIYGSAPSIQVVMAAENGAAHCVVRGPGDVPFTATTWIDVSGAGAANCADMSSPQCQPSPSDPQAHQSGVERYGQTTQVRLDLVDPP